MEACADVTVWQAIGILLVAAWEAWLGKTNKLKSGSTVELLFNLGVGLAKALPKKKGKTK